MKLKTIIVSFMTAIMMAACGGSSVDQTDPVAVAQAAAEGMLKGQYSKVAKLVAPSDTYLLRQFEEMPDRKTPKEITTLTYIKTFDRFAGGGLTENSIGALVVFEMEDGHRLSVELDKIDGKWYYDGLN